MMGKIKMKEKNEIFLFFLKRKKEIKEKILKKRK